MCTYFALYKMQKHIKRTPDTTNRYIYVFVVLLLRLFGIFTEKGKVYRNGLS
jgi:hypothetical protein